jgi:hypothetical protein
MLSLLPLLAAAEAINPVEETAQAMQRAKPKFGGGDSMLIIGIGLFVAAALFFWAFFLRKKPAYQRGSIVIEKRRKDDTSERYGKSGRRRHRKRRREHPDNWGRNPTLGETGGLPPPRPDDPEAPPASMNNPQTQP